MRRPSRPSRFSRSAGVLAAVALLVGGTGAARAQQPENAASKGAQVYCFMRSNGNNHEVSWMAAYALIKRQSASMFKTSPEHAAVMITEAVVQNPGNFPDCGRYLGDLYARRLQEGTPAAPATSAPAAGFNGAGSGGPSRSDRFSN